MLGTLLLFPLDRLKTLMQVESSSVEFQHLAVRVAQEEGRGGFYRGCPVMLQTVGVSNFLYFFLFAGLKQQLQGAIGLEDGVVVGPRVVLVASTAAGVLNMALTEPLWRACVVVQARTGPLASSSDSRGGRCTSSSQETGDRGVFSVVRKMWMEEGPVALWRGLGSSMWLVSNPVIQFFVYDVLKTRSSQDDGSILSLHSFLIGAVAKALATVITFPLQVAQSRLRAASNVKCPPRPELRGMVPCLFALLSEDGVASLYAGLLPKLLQSVTQAAFMFALYENIHRLISRHIFPFAKARLPSSNLFANLATSIVAVRRFCQPCVYRQLWTWRLVVPLFLNYRRMLKS
jgi:adenine nucleotide transporter 17